MMMNWLRTSITEGINLLGIGEVNIGLDTLTRVLKFDPDTGYTNTGE